MNKNLKNLLFYTITFGASFFLLWVVYNSIDVKDENGNPVPRMEFIIDTFKQGDLSLLMISVVCALLAHVVRAERWKLLLDPLGHKITLKEGFLGVMIGYYVNLLIPRGGEVSRSVSVHRMNKKIPVDSALGTIVAERIIDVIFLLVCIGVGFIIEFDNLTYFFENELSKNPKETGGISWILIAGIAGISLLILAIILVKTIRKINIWFRRKVLGFLKGLKEGLLSVFKLKRSGLFIFYSLLIWVLYYFMTYTVLKAFPTTSHLGLLPALSIFAIGGVAMAIPLPGGTGSYHSIVPHGMTLLYAINDNQAVAFAFIFHGWQTIVVIIVGAISMLISNKIAKKHKLELEARKKQNIVA